ncbi:fatty acid desaturase [Amphritea balenae]|uniref:Fatty acid desaturase n=1 Tax=Amphritea balenae TaxID=452629 RepID=A0A3P1SL15_9GAMM|nr:fatty acid desaturase [Amphritea balenae]RRC97757.1 fatty acid desaturase [Amphritea balenae]GGK82790.1 fatty acid desaturase [Amphritea balenae]
MQTDIQKPKGLGVFRYKEDRWPVAIILMLTVIDFVLYFTVDDLLQLSAYYLLMIIPKGTICAWNHHHQHLFTFRNNALNRSLEFFYALHTGVTTHLWRLHHVLGHHLNFLDQEKDESRWMRKDGSKMGVIEYTWDVAITAYPRGYTVGKRHPKQLKPFLIYSLITFLVVALLVWYKPVPALLLFVLPMITSLLFTAYVTYEHHSGLDTENEFEASYNNLNPMFNRLTGNLGYHTAHHHKQGVHWSRLPELHASIADKIPEYLYQKSIITRTLLRG